MSEQNKKMVRRVIEEVENRGNFALADELITDNFVGHSSLEEVQD